MLGGLEFEATNCYPTRDPGHGYPPLVFSFATPSDVTLSPGSWLTSMKMNESGDLDHLQSIKRSATLPARLISHSARASAAALPDNVIFHHPSCRIVQFAPRSFAPIPSASSPSDFDYPVDTVETLPWRSASERTLATAALRIEKVHGLTVFLKCGSIVQPILKNSQCWCVDGVSKFVLRIRPLFYYRIEIPYESPEDKGLVEQLKTALPTILRYEVTPCPFKRAFTVELPEEAMAPRRKRAWRPKDRKDSLTASLGNLQVPLADNKLDTSDSAGDETEGDLTDDSAITSMRANSVTSEASPPSKSPSELELAPESTAKEEQVAKASVEEVAEVPDRRASLTETMPTVLVSHEANLKPTEAKDMFKSVDVALADMHCKKEDAASMMAEDVKNPLESLNTQLSNETEQPDKPSDEPDQYQRTEAEETHLSIEAANQSALTAVLNEEKAVETGVADQSTQSVDKRVDSNPVTANEILTTTESFGITRCNDPHNVTPNPSPKMKEAGVETAQRKTPAHTDFRSAGEAGLLADPGTDQDVSFSSSPESFHSADFLSPSESASTRSSPIGKPDVVSVNSVAFGNDYGFPIVTDKLSNVHSSTSGNISNICLKTVASTSPGPPDASAMSPSATSATETKPSLAVPSRTRTASSSSSRTTASVTDFDHMSTEFRRRAQATRQRDISPMPPPSAIYQPRQGDEATSLLTKALTLVLVPPISLFIVLLHITARIVISPGVTPPSNDSKTSTKVPGRLSLAEDDFDFPLDREASDYEDAGPTNKVDPWDLD
ncbi:hypothetical protein N7468_007408 [Penicillium chermesinum]|uniref:Inheritance of peroxisomes protein 1 n=1 Tax=Penicillium chermesinum TaxID=63820 RepID=A0A9W9NUE3_9EURO|nr:uncharacterized protein N7468_007408 [Penicillium chermesinum]KAJ5226183.1 hypothetical protein N7468_007408 [Penicillium chermesinum]